MTFWVHYVVPPGAAGDRMPVPRGDEIVTVAQTLDVDAGERTVEFTVLAVGAGYQIGTDLDGTGLLRGHPGEVAAARAVDDWVLGCASRAVRIHELLLHRWYEVCSPSHRSAAEALERWLRAQDPAGDYWAALGSATGPRPRS
ncbi:hypothetical protein [Micromonospora fluostatini]|uniref:hypothetical protein n=1 Tax=Micromonospora sp. JCM 30529 TaxID=3421643 RepID=UPI003D163315